MARQEVAGAGLGDSRLDARLERIAEALATRPEASLPQAMGGTAALEATYRFLGNERVSPASILRPHVDRTLQRCAQQGQVLAVFDTTELRFGGDREQLGHLNFGRGLLAHVGLAVSADGKREPLGTLHLETVVRTGAKKRRRNAAGKPDSEQLRWNRGAQTVHQMLPSAICVMDREADVFALIAQMQGRGQRFVVRAAQNRNTEEGLLWELLDDAELISTRTVAVGERRAARRATARKRHPARSAHEATLELRARSVRLCAPNSTRSASTAKQAVGCEVHLVHVIERHPANGEEPIEWVLLTNLPIESTEHIDFIVDAYRARWVIEELFKALKTGCSIEKRQLETATSVTNVLAISLPIAWLLLRLRNLSRDEPDSSALPHLPPVALRCLRALHQKRTGKPLSADPTCREAVWAIAALGGHIKNNGEPGMLVLGRGLADLLLAVDVAEALGFQGEL